MSAETSVVTGIAGRYATALFELARDSGALDQVATDVAGLGGMIDGSDDLNRLLRRLCSMRSDSLMVRNMGREPSR